MYALALKYGSSHSGDIKEDLMSVIRELRATCSLPTVWSEGQAECAIATDITISLPCHLR